MNNERFDFDPIQIKQRCGHSRYLYFAWGSTAKQALEQMDKFINGKCPWCKAIDEQITRAMIRQDLAKWDGR